MNITFLVFENILILSFECLFVAGVDMSTPDPVNSALKLFGELVEELESLL